jgi:Alanine dehydrogenase
MVTPFWWKECWARFRLPRQDYVKAGAEIVEQAKEVFARADMIVKVKEPLKAEFPLLRKGQILFTYLHLAASKSLTEALLKSGVTGVAYETIQVDHRLPLLEPMSEIAGRMSVVMGANFLAKYNGGSGVLLGGVPGGFARACSHPRRRNFGRERLTHGQRPRCRCHNSRRRCRTAAISRYRNRKPAHALFERSKFGRLNARLRFAHRRRAFAGSQSAEADHARNVAKDETRQRDGRYFD